MVKQLLANWLILMILNMEMEFKKKERVTAETLMYEKGYVSPVDLLMKMDKL